ncbi:lytic murein transglycosylase B [Ketobacter sp.]
MTQTLYPAHSRLFSGILSGAFATVTGALLLACSHAVSAAADSKQSESYLHHPKAAAFIEEIRTEKAYPEAKLKALLDSAHQSQSILEAIARPAEKTKTWAEYRPIFMTQDRIDQGVAFYQQHQAVFERAEKEFGVSRYIILAIIGVETRYGKHKGNYRVIDALTTLAFDYPPRSPFFRSELKHFLHLEKEAGIDLMQAKGSYAGAMGFGQFISSSYRHYAVDFNDDDHRDLINDPVDAIGSVANYFKQHGWKTGQPVVSKAQLKKSTAKTDSVINQALKPKLTILELKKAGLIPDDAYEDRSLATAMRFEGAQGTEYWIGLQNFYTITRYNHSPLYAMAVYQLSEALKQRLPK